MQNNTYYSVLSQLTEAFKLENPLVTITHGKIDDFDLNRMTLFPLVHITPTLSVIRDGEIDWSFNITVADRLDWNKENDPKSDEALAPYSTENLSDVLNDTYIILNRAIQWLHVKADATTTVSSPHSVTPFMESYDNYLAGWQLGLTVKTPNITTQSGAC